MSNYKRILVLYRNLVTYQRVGIPVVIIHELLHWIMIVTLGGALNGEYKFKVRLDSIGFDMWHDYERKYRWRMFLISFAPFIGFIFYWFFVLFLNPDSFIGYLAMFYFGLYQYHLIPSRADFDSFKDFYNKTKK